MNAITEIDKAGRLVVPKKLRDALHLAPGTRVLLRQEGESIILAPEEQSKGLYLKNGTWVYDAGRGAFPGDIRDWIDKDRNERDHEVLGDFKRQ